MLGIITLGFSVVRPLPLLNIGVTAEDCLSAFSVFICGRAVVRSQRARERSIRLFIQRFIVVNLPTYFSMSRHPKRAPSIDTNFILRTCCANQPPSAGYRGFPASAYLLTRNQQ